MGLLSSFLESLLGLTMPIAPEEDAALRRRLQEQARGIGSLVAARGAAVLEQPALAAEWQTHESSAVAPAVADVPAPGVEEASPRQTISI